METKTKTNSNQNQKRHRDPGYATIYKPSKGNVELAIPYNPDFLAVFKESIPSHKRDWRPGRHDNSGRWEIDRSELDHVRDLLADYGFSVNEVLS